MGYSSNAQGSEEIKGGNPIDSSMLPAVATNHSMEQEKLFPQYCTPQQQQLQTLQHQQQQQQHLLLQQHQQLLQQQNQAQLLQQMQLQNQRNSNPTFASTSSPFGQAQPQISTSIQAQTNPQAATQIMPTTALIHYPVNTVHGPATIPIPVSIQPLSLPSIPLSQIPQPMQITLPMNEPTTNMINLVQSQPLAQPSPFSYSFPTTTAEVSPILASPVMKQNAATTLLPQPTIGITSPSTQPAPSLFPMHSPKFTIPLTIQDRPNILPTFHPINLNYPNVHQVPHLGSDILHLSPSHPSPSPSQNPPLYVVPDFLTSAECDFLIQHAQSEFTVAPVVGPGVGMVSESRTSSTCYLAREDLPLLMRKVCALTNKPPSHCELPQVGRYLPTQEYRQHFDAFDLSNADGIRFASNGGQRIITVLIYLNTPASGGHTRFPNIYISPEKALEVKPQKGMALIFFPSSVDGLLDKRALHAALPAEDVKYVSQIWIRQGGYDGHPSTSLPKLLDDSVNHRSQGLNKDGKEDIDGLYDLNRPMESMSVNETHEINSYMMEKD